MVDSVASQWLYTSNLLQILVEVVGPLTQSHLCSMRQIKVLVDEMLPLALQQERVKKRLALQPMLLK